MKVLLLGATGKVGTAIKTVWGDDYQIVGKSSGQFQAEEFGSAETIMMVEKADIVINCAVCMGIDKCEESPDTAYKVNAEFPAKVAALADKMGSVFIHFSTDAVFDSMKGSFYDERDQPNPVNIYGKSKWEGDQVVLQHANSYVFRLPLLFGPTKKRTQFVERMLKNGKVIRIADDIISSPTLSTDAAKRVKDVVERCLAPGLYHVTNSGMASLYDLMREIVTAFEMQIKVEPASYREFPIVGQKNTYTPLTSVRLPAMARWQDAVRRWASA